MKKFKNGELRLTPEGHFMVAAVIVLSAIGALTILLNSFVPILYLIAASAIAALFYAGNFSWRSLVLWTLVWPIVILYYAFLFIFNVAFERVGEDKKKNVDAYHKSDATSEYSAWDRSDADAIRSDWEQVGEDLRAVMSDDSFADSFWKELEDRLNN